MRHALPDDQPWPRYPKTNGGCGWFKPDEAWLRDAKRAAAKELFTEPPRASSGLYALFGAR